MKLVDYNVKDFVNLLASDSPAPGGGSSAALEGAIGSALIHMVSSLTVGKKKYADQQELVASLLERSKQLKLNFIDVIDRDTEAFNQVSAVFSMPKETDEEKKARKEAMQKGLKACTQTPYEMMQYSMRALELASEAVGKTNASAASDLGVAVLSLKAAIQGAWLNILINISGIEDEAFVSSYRANGEDLLKEALPLADKIYNDILNTLI